MAVRKIHTQSDVLYEKKHKASCIMQVDTTQKAMQHHAQTDSPNLTLQTTSLATTCIFNFLVQDLQCSCQLLRLPTQHLGKGFP